MEDDPSSRKFLTFILSSLNIEFIEAMSGERALRLMENEEVDGMLLDIALGAGISGVTLMEKFRSMERFKDLPIIAVTAFEDLVVGKFGERGFSGILRKPYTYDQLKDILITHGIR